jgi:hypothetical protein
MASTARSTGEKLTGKFDPADELKLGRATNEAISYARRTCNQCRNASQPMGSKQFPVVPESHMLVSATPYGRCSRNFRLAAGSSARAFALLHCTPTGCSDAPTPQSLSPGTALTTERYSRAKNAGPLLHSSAVPHVV